VAFLVGSIAFLATRVRFYAKRPYLYFASLDMGWLYAIQCAMAGREDSTKSSFKKTGCYDEYDVCIAWQRGASSCRSTGVIG